MNALTLGDLSHSYTLRQRNVALRQQVDRLATELASGRVAEVRDVLDGNYSYLADIERRMSVLGGFGVATAEAGVFAETVQQALGVVHGHGADLSSSLLAAGAGPVGAAITDTVAEARSALDGMVSAVNARAAGRHLFSGIATNQAPLPGSEDILDALRTAIAGAATPDDMLTASQAWFDSAAGFAAMVYQGSDTRLSPHSLSESDQVSVSVLATDPALREVLRLTALSALADDPAFALDAQARAELFDKTGQAVLVAQDNVIGLQSDVGFAQARIDKVAARNAAEATSLEYAKLDLLQIDPYEAATRLEEAQFQLQSLYSVTVRMSQLSLANFL